MYPQKYPLTEGFAVANVRVFKAPLTERINAYDGAYETTSMPFTQMIPNAFERLLVLTNGLSSNNGYFEAEPPATFNMFLGTPVDRFVNDSPVHPATAMPFRIFSCDAYGNVTITADALGHTITVTTNDPYAPAIADAWIPPSFFVDSYVEFHTAMSV